LSWCSLTYGRTNLGDYLTIPLLTFFFVHSNQQGLHVPVITEILTGQLAEPLLLCRLRVLVSHACDGAAPKIADNARRIIRGGQASRGIHDDAGDDESARRSKGQIGPTPKLWPSTRLGRQSRDGYAEITDFMD
jgi:hypothetical protein